MHYALELLRRCLDLDPKFDAALYHLGLIYLATVIFVAGALLALRGIITQHRH